MNILQEIEQYRLAKQLSQEKMAGLLGISQQVYNKISKGTMKRVDPEIIAKFKAITGDGDRLNEAEYKADFKMTLADLGAVIMENNAMLNVLMSASAEILANQRGTTATAVLAEFQTAYTSYVRRSENAGKGSSKRP